MRKYSQSCTHKEEVRKLKFTHVALERQCLTIGLGIGQAGLQGPTAWPVLAWPGLDCLVDRPRLRLFRKPV
ncbi:hypothetical protein MTR_8g040100 [Medicago truncatula]|uniref:Uncharacterized protein n=1 Tax=Medicago truncatula TaxID=3880 RepID=G7LGW0_MEDTR|nr:hypothetical protein MTR_8g040100 [Medicago truncatula]